MPALFAPSLRRADKRHDGHACRDAQGSLCACPECARLDMDYPGEGAQLAFAAITAFRPPPPPRAAPAAPDQEPRA